MCNHFEKNQDVLEWALSASDAKLNAEAAAAMKEWKDHCYPKLSAGILVQNAGERELVSMRWGRFVVIEQRRKLVSNSRNDRLQVGFWKHATKRKRCLIPAAAYFEPGAGPVGAKGEVRFVPSGRSRFFIAGLYDDDADDTGGTGFTMVTTEPNEYAVKFHSRMPVVLTDEDALRWLGDQPLADDILRALLRGLPADQLAHTEIPAAKGKIATADIRRAVDAGQGDLFA